VESRPILWHIEISHYNEKVRWALDYKGVEHERRAPIPGFHIAVALARTHGRSYTFPMLALDGRRIGDSTAIIAALEERYPDPPLYPAGEAERRRALELEDWFDRELGPYMRRYAFHELRKDRKLTGEISSQVLPKRLARFTTMAGAYARAFTALRFGAASDRRADEARERILIALDELESRLGGNEYLVGERFSVADLTAASLFYPLVLPPEGPQTGIPADAFEELTGPLGDRRGLRWVREMFRRHRHRWSSGIRFDRQAERVAG